MVRSRSSWAHTSAPGEGVRHFLPQVRALVAKGEHHTWAVVALGLPTCGTRNSISQTSPRTPVFSHDLQLHIADKACPVKQVRAVPRIGRRSVRDQQVGKEWFRTQELPELRRSNGSPLIQQVVRTSDCQGAAATRLDDIQEGEDLHACALAACGEFDSPLYAGRSDSSRCSVAATDLSQFFLHVYFARLPSPRH